MKKLFTLTLSILITISILTFSTSLLADDLYSAYGIQHDNIIFLKIDSQWQEYTINSDYVGYSCKLIIIDKELSQDNYKNIQIVDTEDIENIDQANLCVNEWNNRNQIK